MRQTGSNPGWSTIQDSSSSTSRNRLVTYRELQTVNSMVFYTVNVTCSLIKKNLFQFGYGECYLWYLQTADILSFGGHDSTFSTGAPIQEKKCHQHISGQAEVEEVSLA